MKSIEIKTVYQNEYALDEAFKMVRTNIMFSSHDTKVISMTSCNSHDGKSTVSFEVAKNLAQASKRVLYIDADMRKSVFASKLTNETDLLGLSHFLSGQNGIGEVMYKTNFENLFVIFSGIYPPNPAELLAGSLFKGLIDDARENFDYVIIDTPPLGLVSDAASCIAYSDGAIMLVTSEQTRFSEARELKKYIENTGTKLLGCVINKLRRSNNKYYYYRNYK